MLLTGRLLPSGQGGPRLAAFTSLLMGMFRQSKRRVYLFCETLLNHPVSVGLLGELFSESRHQPEKLVRNFWTALTGCSITGIGVELAAVLNAR